MRSISIVGPEQAETRQIPIPSARDEYVVVRNEAIPICTEFKSYFSGETADEIGHEAAGEVVEVAQPGRVAVGDRVVVMPGFWCGRCEHCLRGEYIHCEQPVDRVAATGSSSGFGTYAEYMVKADWMLVPIPDGLCYDHAGMACCGLGPALNAIRTAGVEGTDTVLVAGLGPAGLGAVIVARYFGARVIGLARNEYRSELAKKLGAELVVHPDDPEAMPQIAARSHGGPRVAIDTTGAETYVRFLLGSLRRRGHLAIVGEGGAVPIELSDDLIRNGLHLHGIWHYSMADTPLMMRMIQEVGDKLDIQITHRFALDQVESAWRLQQTGSCGKVVLHP